MSRLKVDADHPHLLWLRAKLESMRRTAFGLPPPPARPTTREEEGALVRIAADGTVLMLRDPDSDDDGRSRFLATDMTLVKTGVQERVIKQSRIDAREHQWRGEGPGCGTMPCVAHGCAHI